MSASKSPPYDELKRRMEAAESALKAIREGRVDTILGERETLVVRLAEAEAREAHLKQVLLAIRNVNQLIVAEDDPQRLIEQACVNLTETMGYHNAWIALLGGKAGLGLGLGTEGPVATAAAAGFDVGFETLRERLERGEFPECMKRAMENEDTLVKDDPMVDCPDCPLHAQYGGRAGLVRRLDAGGVTYGILTASVPAAYARNAEEQELFNEVAGDLAFALYKIAAARKLEENRQHLSFVIEGSGVGTWEWNVRTNETLFNEQWATMLGYTIEELTPYDYGTWERLVHPEDLERARQALADCVEGRTTDYNCEFRMKHKDGRWVWILDRGRIMTRDDAGKALSMFGTHTDITDLKQTEEALKRQHTMLARTEAIAHVGSWEWDIAEDRVRWSDELFRIFGRNPDTEAPSFAQHLEIYLPEDMERLKEAVEHCVSQGTSYELELRAIRSDGEIRHCFARGQAETDETGRVVRLAGSLQDLTEQKKQHERISLLVRMLDEAPASITIHDVEGGFLYANRETFSLHGYDEDEFMSINLHELDVPESEALLEERFRLIFEKGEASFEVNHYRKDGTAFPLQVLAKQVQWEDRPAVLSIATDISDRKRMERRHQVLADIIKRSRDFIGVADFRKEAFFVNPAGREMVGLDGDEEVAGTKIEDYFLKEDIAFVNNVIIPTVVQEGRWAGEFRFRHFKTGKSVPVLYDLFRSEDPSTGEMINYATVTRDITERKRTEDALKFANTKLSIAMQAAGQGLWEWSLSTDTVHFDDAALEMLGYRREDIQGPMETGKWWISQAHPDDKAYMEERFDRYLSGKEKEYHVEFRLKDKDGGYLWVESSARVISKDPAGNPEVVVGIHQDISKRKRIEQNLIQSEKNYRDIFDNSSDCIFIHDATTGAIVDVNRTTCETFGYSVEEIKHLEVGDFSLNRPPYTSAEAVEWIKKAHKEGPQRFEWLAKDRMGRLIWFENNLLNAQIGGKDRILVFGSNIDDRKQIERELRRSEEHFRFIVDHSYDLIWTLMVDGVFSYVSPSWKTRLGYQPSDVMGEAFQQFVHPDDIAGCEEYMWKVLDAHSALTGYQYRARHADGSWRWHEAVMTPTYAEDDSFLSFVGVSRDITDRKRLEEVLRESEQRLQAVFNAVDSVPIQGYDKDRRVVFWNPASEKLYGYIHDEAVGRPLEELIIPEESRESVVEAIRQWHDHDIPIPAGEIELLNKNCERLQVHSNHIMITNHRGDKEMFCIDVDLTDIRRIEQSMASLSAVVENSDNIVVVKDLDLRVVATNPAFAKAAGHPTVDTMIGKTDAEIFGVTPDTEPIRSYMEDERRAQTLPPGEYILREEPVVTPDGGVRTVLTKKYPIYDRSGNLIGTGNISTDITERKQAEERQKNLATELEEILDSLPDAVVYADTDRRIKKVNPSFTRIFGYNRDEILGKKTRIIYRNDEEYLEQGRKRYNPKAPQMWEPYEFYHVRKDGTEFISETVGTPVHNSQGEVVGLLGLVRDITEKKQSESENEKLQAQLRQAQKMESVGRLAGGVAHDFNNMLGVILGSAEMALDDTSPYDPQYASLKEIYKAARRSSDLTRQLLAFARKQTISPEILDLNKTVEAMLKMLRRLIGEDIDLSWMPGSPLWKVKMDPSQIDQILANLCVNAKDAIAGTGRVTIETVNVTLDEAQCAEQVGFLPGEYVLLALSDNGCGMDSETMSHLFEPFFTTKAVGHGTGLGLATIYGIVKQNGGFIYVESEPGRGTTFSIYFPRHVYKVEAFSRAETKTSAELGSETILLVEDEEAMLNMAKTMLERLGYRVLACGTPVEAERLTLEHGGEIHLLMTDVIMPEMNGRELAERLISRYPNMRSLFTSGYTADVIGRHGVLNEGVHFIQKPFSKKDLAAKVREALSTIPRLGPRDYQGG